MVDGVGEMLRLEAKGVAALIDPAAFAGDSAVEEIAGVKLHAGLRWKAPRARGPKSAR